MICAYNFFATMNFFKNIFFLLIFAFLGVRGAEGERRSGQPYQEDEQEKHRQGQEDARQILREILKFYRS